MQTKMLSIVATALAAALLFSASFARATDKETVLHTFVFGSGDGVGPFAGLVSDAAGNLYGTTAGGGYWGGGTVFELLPATGGGWTETVLYSFPAMTYPESPLIFDATGNLYGTAANDVGVTGFGAVFKLAPKPGGAWAYSVLRSFYDHPAAFPYGSLVLDKAGNLYGTASDCANGNVCNGDGVVFEISP